MAITNFQRGICRLVASSRVERGESYVAGGVALNTHLAAERVSRDIDLFHDTREALVATWSTDRELLEGEGYTLDVRLERPTFVEAVVRRGGEQVVVLWVCDSAFRFFPLVEHPDLGLTLHPFDLATNKVLALVGRLEVRDWVDVIACNDRLQPLGYLAWAACGKDPGYSPSRILAEARRSSRYTDVEVAELAFEAAPPDAAELSRKWSSILVTADDVVEGLPPDEVGTCVMTAGGELFRGTPPELQAALAKGSLRFHGGRIGGVLPTIL